MNWVGGSRNRLMMKNDAKKQREFFERRKMQQKLQNMGIALPESPKGASSGSMDLVTLFVVNQIAAKKENKDPPKVAVLSSCNRRSKHKRNEPLVLPMSPCSPSQLSLVESQPQYSVQGTRKRKHVIPQGFKCQQLSPVLESAFSDNSASDYLLPRADLLSPFSSTSSASSGQGIFPLQLNLQQRGQTQAQPPPHCSPPPWDTSGLEQTEFQPFSQPRGMTDGVSWSSGSNLTFYQLETPTAAQVLFGSPKPNKARDRARREVTFSLNQAGDKDPILDFTLNQSESEQQFEEDVFRGFSNEEYDREASHFGSAKTRLYLKEETPVKSSAPQTVPDSQCMGVELSNCTDMNFSCLEHNNGCMNGCEFSPSYSCRGGYLSSDSNDDEEFCQSMDHTCCTDTVNPNLGSEGNPTHRPLTPHIKPQKNTGDYQKCMENDLRSDGTAQFVSPHSQTPISEQCKCEKTSNEMRNAGTQTVNIFTVETCDASTQCSLVLDSVSKAPGFNLHLPSVDMSVQHSATGRQTGCIDAAAESTTHTDSSANSRSGGNHTPWSKTQFKAGSLSGILNKFTANISEGKVILQRPINPFVDVLSMTEGKGEQDGEGREERGQQENGPLMKDFSDEVREELTSTTRVNRLSEEAETLQEIADILLLLKQRKREG
ncbi:uncharacterized protein LOC121890857 isoform X2 [Thunnus maccoyii]|uniref:uncharacterized protein LOC121890857 isoform X2 n=1 Tax=Thunnus maccoyii TaxID=8240 RepID=UPI001C4DBE29|nr:uncharacterized protein LOC121890857 isoform X2 [Thunnus maccoyii]